MRSDSHTQDASVLTSAGLPEAAETLQSPELSLPLPNPKSDPVVPGRNPKFSPTPAQRLDDLAQIIRAYNAVTENLQHSHESLQAEVIRLQEKLATTDAQLQRSRRLAALGEMAAGIAHEIRNPLGAIQLYAGLIVDDLQHADRQTSPPAAVAALAGTAETARKIVSAVRGLNAIVSDVLSFARDVAPRPQPVSAVQIFDRAIESHRPAIAAASVAIDRADHRRGDEQDRLLIHADPELLHQAVLNMVRNAVEAMTTSESQNPQSTVLMQQEIPAPEAPEAEDQKAQDRNEKFKANKKGTTKSASRAATIGLSRLTAGKAHPYSVHSPQSAIGNRPSAIPSPLLTLDARREGSMIVLVMRDTGPGIAQEDIDRIFNPFFTTRNTGTGLGLAIVHRIVDAHGGSIAVHNDHGAVFEIRLPAADHQPSPQAIPDQAAAAPDRYFKAGCSMSNKILVVDDKQMMRDSVATTLQRAGYQAIVAGDGDAAISMVARHRPLAVITDLKMPEMDGLELLGRLRQADDHLPIVLMTAFGSIDLAVRAIKDGAFDFIQKPFEGDQLVLTIRRAVEHRQLLAENAALKTNVRTTENSPVLVGRSGVMRQLAQQIQQIAQSHGTVLISGESGTGKEVVARTVHAHSLRRDRMMLCLNCAALSSGLLESELFGHERGAFTGADQLRKGRFELADGGTLLLDEISEISSQLQAKLLRVLQERQFERVGSSMTMQVDVRVIATTNRDLTQSVANGDFRQDLYYRLNVLPIVLPPLRARSEDVPLLAQHFLMQVALREGRDAKHFDEEAMNLLRRYPWPGNVRELQNICERAAVLTREQVITGGTIQPWLVAPQPASAPAGTSAFSIGRPFAAPAPVGARRLEEFERDQIIRTLGVYNGNRQRTAEALGIGVRTLGLKLKKWKEQNLVAQTI